MHDDLTGIKKFLFPLLYVQLQLNVSRTLLDQPNTLACMLRFAH